MFYLRSDDAYVMDDPDYMPTFSATILQDWTKVKEGTTMGWGKVGPATTP